MRLHDRALRAYDWLVGLQRLTTAPGTITTWPTASEQDKLDANTCAYVAAGVWHHYLLTRDLAFLEQTWSMVEPAIDFVLDLQTRAARSVGPPADGTPVVVRAADRLVEHLPLRCAAPSPSPRNSATNADWELSVARLARVIATEPDAFAPSTAGPWTGTTRCSPAC